MSTQTIIKPELVFVQRELTASEPYRDYRGAMVNPQDRKKRVVISTNITEIQAQTLATKLAELDMTTTDYLRMLLRDAGAI